MCTFNKSIFIIFTGKHASNVPNRFVLGFGK